MIEFPVTSIMPILGGYFLPVYIAILVFILSVSLVFLTMYCVLKIIINYLGPHHRIVKKFNSAISVVHTNGASQPVVDLGVGAGGYLKKYVLSNPSSVLTGVDVSSQMLKVAKSAGPLKGVNASICDVNQHLPANKFDVVIAHFV